MGSSLNLCDIGDDRKAALETEAEARGMAVADLVRAWIDEGLARAGSERARDAWIAAAGAGIADEARHLRDHGPTLARFRGPAGRR